MQLQLRTYFVQYAHYHARLDHFHLFDVLFDSFDMLSLICRTCRAHRLHFPQRRSNYGNINSCFLYLLKVATRVRISGQGNDRRLLIRIIIWPKIKHQIAPSRERQREREGRNSTLKHLHRNLSWEIRNPPCAHVETLSADNENICTTFRGV